jgi:hypothetical protein
MSARTQANPALSETLGLEVLFALASREKFGSQLGLALIASGPVGGRILSVAEKGTVKGTFHASQGTHMHCEPSELAHSTACERACPTHVLQSTPCANRAHRAARPAPARRSRTPGAFELVCDSYDFVRDGRRFFPGTCIGFTIDPVVGSRPTRSGGTTALSSWKIASATSAFA